MLNWRRSQILGSGVVTLEILDPRAGIEDHDLLVPLRSFRSRQAIAERQNRPHLPAQQRGLPVVPTSRVLRIISSSSTVTAPPSDSRRILSMRKSPTAFGTRSPGGAGMRVGKFGRARLRRLRTRERSVRSRSPAPKTCAAASSRSSPAPPFHRTPSTCRSGPCRRRSDKE